MKVQTSGRILLHTLFRQKRIIMVMMLSILGTVLIGTLVWPPSYEAASTVLVRSIDSGNILYPEPSQRNRPTMLLKPQELLNTEIEIIRSRPVLARVVESTNLHIRKQPQTPGPLQYFKALFRTNHDKPVLEKDAVEAAITRLGKQLRLEPAVDSQVIRIVYRHRDPVTATEVVNRIAEEYLKQHRLININSAESGFYAEQIEAVEGELVELQDELAELKGQEGILSFPEQSAALIRKVESFEVARATVQNQIIGKRAKVKEVRKLLASEPDLLIPLPEIASDIHIEDLENRRINLNRLLVTLRQRYTEESRQVTAAREQAAQVLAQIRRQVNLFLERETAELRKLEAEELALNQTLRNLKEEVKKMAREESLLKNLERQVEDKQSALTLLRQRHQDSVIAQGADLRLINAKIVSQASVPLKPASPNFLLNLILGLILSIVVAFSVAFVVDYWDDSLKVPEDVERLFGRRVFASIPEF